MIRKGPKVERLLTETELELMTIIWRLGSGTVAEVLRHLPPPRAMAYTSASTILRILEQKGVLNASKEGKGHRYHPLVAKADYESRSLANLLSKVFDDAPTQLVSRLLDQRDLSAEDIAAIRQMLDERS